MPITKSAKKALRQSKKRQAHNFLYVKRIKELTKKALLLVRDRKKEELENLLPVFYKAVDKAAKVGVLKKNTAARKKSRIARGLARLNAAGLAAVAIGKTP